MNIDQLAPDEPLSPELVLVFAPELRAQALAGLTAPFWASPRPRPRTRPIPPADRPLERSLGAILVTRVAHLTLIFVALTILTLAMSVVAHAVR